MERTAFQVGKELQALLDTVVPVVILVSMASLVLKGTRENKAELDIQVCFKSRGSHIV